MSQMWEAAGVGHRITHEDDLPEAQQLVVVTETVRSLLSSGGASFGAELSADFARRLASLVRGVRELVDFEGRDVGDCPDPCGTIERGSENTFIGGDLRQVALCHDDHEVDCDEDSDGPIAQGAIHVYVNGVPWGRRNDELGCGARIGEGEPTILIGGEPTERKERRLEDVRSPTAFGPALSRWMRTDAVDAVEIGRQLCGTGPGPAPERRASGASIGQALSRLWSVATSALVGR